ncbi:MAG: hypothetical protein DI535_17790 [Citrobacter freundii]|nr:MAG: hypothetical protein DI535_17790 [Citrobacter freundii]
MSLIFRTGYLSAIFSFTAVAGYGIAQILQVFNLISYPWDELFIYGFSLCIAIPFLITIIALHQTLPSYKKMWSGIAAALATAYVVFALMVYVVQLMVVLPADAKDSRLDILRMSPHSLFWTLDALAYLCMGIAVLFLVPALKDIDTARWLRRLMIAHVVMTVVAMFVYFYPQFSTGLLVVASPWLLTAGGVCAGLAIYFRKGNTLYIH